MDRPAWLRGAAVSLVHVLVLSLLLVSCGGDGGDDLGPLWVETDVAVADIDGDGRADVLTLAMYQHDGPGEREGRLLVYRQTATPGVFAAPDTYVVGTYPWRVALGDVDGDGRPDLLVADPGDDSRAWLVLQDATRPGRFRAPQTVITGAISYGVAIADLNGDGAADVVSNDAAGTARRAVVRYQDPANRGSFGPQVDLALSGASANVAAADIDGDGRDDLLAWVQTDSATHSAGLVALFQQPGGVLASSGPIAVQTGLNNDRLAITDATRDGRRDLFAFLSPYSADYKGKLVVVPQAMVARSFDAPVETSTAAIDGIDDAVLADLDQDGVPDAAIVGFWATPGGPLSAPIFRSRVTLLFNDGSGAFARPVEVDLPIAVSRVSAGDLDGDGRTDLVLLGENNQCLVMFQSATPGRFGAPRPLR